MAFRKMSKIRAFKDIRHDVQHKFRFEGLTPEGVAVFNSNPLPTIPFVGQVKLHGTNGSIVRLGRHHHYGRKSAGHWMFQSKEREVSVGSDNMGFAAAMTEKVCGGVLETFFNSVIEGTFGAFSQETDFLDFTYILYGEWCGQGIQSGVAITQLPKMFVVFTVARVQPELDQNGGKVVEFFEPRLDNTLSEDWHRENGLWLTTQFPTYEIEIDFEDLEPAVQRLEQLTEQVEQQCPVGAFFGVEGIGEGIVWKPAVDRIDNVVLNDSGFWFKTKGEKHKHTKNRGQKSGIEIDFAKMNNVGEFAEATVTEVRLQQAWDFLVENGLPLTKASTGHFVNWMFNDIVTEEVGMLVASGLTAQDVKGALGERSRNWFFQRLF
jgi:hypothetical protein